MLTQEVAVVPFLWVIPLSIYLLSFIVTFSGEKWYLRNIYSILLAISILLIPLSQFTVSVTGLLGQIAAYSLFLLFSTLICNGELYRLRPSSQHLTRFYCWISVGGALGGVFANLVAPLIFKNYTEFRLGMLVTIIILLVLKEKPTEPKRLLRSKINFWLIVSPGVLMIVLSEANVMTSRLRDIERNFYGVIKVTEINRGGPGSKVIGLVHGITIHGYQYETPPEKRDIPTSYFGMTGGAGLVFENYPRETRGPGSASGLRVGVVGLGIGTVAAYGQAGDDFRFYEINPAVIDLAEGKAGYFSYLDDTPANYEIIAGDARISLEQELRHSGPQRFDILILDAFSGDAIPVHLLTREAFQVYLQHLQPEGVIAVNISNRYLQLAPVLQKHAGLFDLELAYILNKPDDPAETPSEWVILSRNSAFMDSPAIQARAQPVPTNTRLAASWTDDYSNLFQVLKPNSNK